MTESESVVREIERDRQKESERENGWIDREG